MIGYVTKVRLTSFLAGAATASFAGIYLLHQDYKACHDSIAQEVKGFQTSLDDRISALEKLKEIESAKH
nr:transmembrane protein, putative [Ipomoea batatas]GME00541.1 transmembrane protein, putative [Ipomoea batatas]